MIQDPVTRRDVDRAERSGERGPAREASSPDLDWFISQFEHLVREYPDEWLVIHNQEVAAHAATPGELRTQIRALGIRSPFIARSHPNAWANLK